MKRSRKIPGLMNYIVFVMCLFVGVPSYTQIALAQGYNVITVAGSTQGYADGVGVNAKFNSPTNVQFDANGNVYVVDWLNNYIRKISPTGNVTTFAGSGSIGYRDGVGTNAQFTYPNSIAIAADGTIYVSDRMSHYIRKISPAGVVTTFAGNGTPGYADGMGTTAQLNRPSGIALDKSGNLYVADYENQRIRKITPSGLVSTIAGNGIIGYVNGAVGIARFNNPAALTIDNQGNIYVADAFNNCIRKISTDGIVSTFAGKNIPGFQDGIGTTARFFYPHGIAYDSNNGNFYVGDMYNNRVRKINSIGLVSTIAGAEAGSVDGLGTEARFNNPYGVSVDMAGNIYVADLGNNRIRKITPVSPSAVFEGTIFSEDAANNGSVPTTYNVTLANTAWSNTIPNGATLTQGIHFSAANVPAGLTAVVTKVNASQATISFSGNATLHTALASVNNVQLTFTDAALNGGVASGVQGLNGANLSIVFTGQDCNTVTTFAGSGTIASVDGVGTAASFIDPYAVTTDKSGNVYVADGTKIRKITPAGVVSTFAGAAGGLGAMNGIAIDRNGNLLAIEQTLVRKITPAGVISTIPITGATIPNGSDIAVDAFGNIYISDGIASIYKITPNAVAKRLNNQDVIAAGIAVDAIGNVYCGGYNTNKVFKVALNGTVTTIAGSGVAGYADGTGTSAQFNQPVGVTLDASGNLYVMDYVGSRIRKITPNGVVSTIAGSGTIGYADGAGTTAQFNYPLHIALDTLGNLFVTDRLNYRIRAINVCGASGALPGAAAYSGTTFLEATANNGSVSTTQTIALFGGGTWTSTVANGTALTVGTHFSAVNVPPGLTAVVTKISSTQAIISFTGNATSHQSVNSVSNVQLVFTDAALNTSTTSVLGLNGVNLSITFRNLGTAAYSGTTFPEATANDGTVTTTQTITLTNEQWTPAVGLNTVLVAGSHYTATGVPVGLLLRITKISATVATISFTGSALAHQNANDSVVTLTFTPQALASLTPTDQVVGLNRALTVDFRDNASAFYSGTLFTESAANDGKVSTTHTVTLAFDTFVPTGVFTEGVHFTATGVPAGLSLTITRASQSSAVLSFSGTAAAHANVNDASVTLTFLNAAVASGLAPAVIGLTPKTLTIDFNDPVISPPEVVASVGYAPYHIARDAAGNFFVPQQGTNKVYKVLPQANGSVQVITGFTSTALLTGGIAIDSSGNIFVATLANTIEKLAPGASVSTTFHASSALSTPFGLDVDKSGNLYVASFDNASIVKITPAGQASVLYQGSPLVHPIHAILDNDGHLVVADFGNSSSGNGTGNLFKIYLCSALPPRLIAQNLNVPNGLTRTKSGRIFITNAAPGAGLLQYAEPQVLAATSGLGQLQTYPVAGTLSEPVHIGVDQQGDMYITENVGRISRIRTTGELPITLGASAQAAVGTLSATQFTFPEAAVNNGTITKKDTLGMSCGTFSNADTLRLGIDYLVSNVPPGLTLVLKRIAQDKLQLNFAGAALAHQSVNNATAVLQFLNPAISSGNGAQLPSVQLAITFLNNPPPTTATATYSDSVFTETAANTGQVTTTRTVTLSGASFVTGAYTDGTHFTATGVPAGLTLTVTRLTSTQVRLAFTGTAAAHALANSTNVGLTFLPAVLTGGNVAGVVGLTPKTLRVNFLDPYTASYSDTTFAESIANDGTVPTVRTLTLVGVNFTTTATTLVQGMHFNVSGVPAGLTLTVTKIAPNVAQIAFSGAAASHVVDVNNITLSFLNAALESGSGTAAAVLGLTPKKLSIDFIAPYTATYSAKNFVEGPANDGTVLTVRTLTLFGGDSFLPATLLQGAHFTATGVPSGLTMVMTRTSSSTVQISFTGAATNHANVNDASISITFTPEALASGNPSAVVGLTPATLTIDFRDPDVAPPSSPNILGFTPQVGTTGTVVTISGFGFTGTQNVLFGGAPAKSFTVVSDSTITAVVDYGSTGDVTVVNAQGFAILPGFTYVPRPVINSFTPTTGNSGAVVTITGSNFQGTALNGTSWTTTSVYFGSTPATSFTVLSPTQIQATVGAGATGAVRVETLPGNVGVRNGFCYMAPLITAFAPTSASTGTQVVITGSNFTGATAVKFNGKAAASFAVVSDTQITAFPATGTPLTGSISVTTPQCTDDLATFTFIPAPIVYGFWLSGGTDGDVITIDGVNFTGASGVKFGDTVAASYTVVSPTRIQAVVGSGKTGAVSVIGPGGVGSRSKFIYYAPGAGRPNPPIITSFTPTEGPDGTVVTINGLNFQGADWYTTAVRIGDAPDGPKTAIIQSMTATKLVVKVNGGATGLIRVYTPAGVTTSTQTFTYFPPPTISAFTPTTGGAGTTVTILGTEFTGVTSVKFGGVSATSFTVDSPTQITATVGTGNTGRVQVVASGGTATSSVNFTLPTPPPAPTVTTFSPAIATTGTVITINGTNFTGATQVTFGGTPAQSYTVVSASRITAVVGGGASGSVAVTTPSGSASKTGFTYLPKPLPTITSFSPASASPGQTVTILGTYFTGATQVFMGSASVPFTVIHSGKITVEVPTNAASGVIRVVTPDGVAMRSGFTFIPLVAMLDNFGGAHLTSAPPSEPLILAERNETSESVSLGVYPNPATDVVTLTATGFGDGRVVNITLLNTLGQSILTLNKESIGGNLQTRVDVRDMASGAYTAVLSDGAVRHVVRFVKR